MPETISSLLQRSLRDLQNIAKNPYKEANLMLAHALKAERIYLYSHPDDQLTAKTLADFTVLLNRRLQGEPLAYILGECEFWSLKLEVNQHVLIPRPETELLVELALKYLDENKPLKVTDLGTGSGAIALALAFERPHWSIAATDKSLEALQLAQANATQLNVKNIEFYSGDWFQAIPDQIFDAIISNPPYVAIDDPALEATVKFFEPDLALTAGADGLDALRVIIAEAPIKLVAGGWLLLEHGYNQSEAVKELMQQRGFTDVACFKDCFGRLRVTVGMLSDRV